MVIVSTAAAGHELGWRGVDANVRAGRADRFVVVVAAAPAGL